MEGNPAGPRGSLQERTKDGAKVQEGGAGEERSTPRSLGHLTGAIVPGHQLRNS